MPDPRSNPHTDRYVIFDVQRHGHRLDGGDELSDLGRRQIQTAMKHHGLLYVAAFYSGFNRTHETAYEAMRTLNLDREPQECLGFGYQHIENQSVPRFKEEDAIEEIKRIKGDFPFTVWNWLEQRSYPGVWALRGMVTATLLDISHRVTVKRAPREFDEKPAYVYAASHSPTGEMATLTPSERLMLKVADIIRYHITVPVSGFPYITKDEYLPCPPVD